MRARTPRRLRKKSPPEGLHAVVDECIVLADRLRWVAEQIHGDEGRRSARRGILRGLARYGPQTVPQLARARSVSRQNIQPVVSALVAEGLVARTKNPAHSRSPLVAISQRGADLVRRMDRNDARVLAAVGIGLDPHELAAAVRTLRAVRIHFESALRWKTALED